MRLLPRLFPIVSMAAYDLEEQDKLAELKAWWARFGTAITAALVVVALALAGWNGWAWWQNKRAAEASALYFALQEGLAKNEPARVKDATTQLLERYAGTAYAARAALLAAKAAFDAGELDQARTHLEWVVAHSKEEELRATARLRLASVLLDLKKPEAALAVLDGKRPAAFEGLFLDARGDVFLAMGKFADAKAAYEAALSKLDSRGGLRQYVQLKLDYATEAAK
ncbi:MAG: tetratricopeptide repeat protein [Casimicrobiaceae bacterium]|nr:tetratricopeptide repeat protein [Casimicrobiaceae bacterium]MDW8312402.1 tetratricopeptide repeat protein [Burkholderiales bacterium]